MPRPATKQDLIKTATEQFATIWKLIDSMTDDELIASFQFDAKLNKKDAHWSRDKNIRDVLIHLYEWQQLLLNWVSDNNDGNKGEEKPFLPRPYNWKNYGDMNIEFWEKHQTTSYARAKELLGDSHNNVLKLIMQFSNEELFTKQYFSWTGATSLGSYCVSATSSHYDWAIKKIKQHLKSFRNKLQQ